MNAKNNTHLIKNISYILLVFSPFTSGCSKQDAANDLTSHISTGKTPDSATNISIAKQTIKRDLQKPQKQPQCFTLTYKHKFISSHLGDEGCSQHRNLVKLKHENINPASVCVRVNNSPVHHKFNKQGQNEILIDPTEDLKTKITINYCLGNEKCKQTCPAPKDEFMEAIAGPHLAKHAENWTDDGDSMEIKLSDDLKKKLENLDPSSDEKLQVFTDWITESEINGCTETGASS